MGKFLVIVESPAKARTINRYLGEEYEVHSSVGHVRDLPVNAAAARATSKAKATKATKAAKVKKTKGGKTAAVKRADPDQALFERMGIWPDKKWKANYSLIPGKEKVIHQLRKLADKAERIYLATDLDREGEAIAWHLSEVLGGEPARYSRVVFNEITVNSIRKSFASPATLNMDRVNAQQFRRFLDRIVGFMVSPLLWKRIAPNLSAGRVQSVALRMIVERDREISAFLPEEYWRIQGRFDDDKGQLLTAQVSREDDHAFRPANEEHARQAEQFLSKARFVVADRTDRPTKISPSPPFTTSTLQQVAGSRLGFRVNRTMSLAQRLYEAGHITYMRTDSTHLSQESVQSCRDYIGATWESEYLPPKPRHYASGASAQEAHEAIRPSDVRRTPASLKDMPEDAQRLYGLIRNRFIACQMADARATSSSLVIAAHAPATAQESAATAGEHAGPPPFQLRAKGRIIHFDGCLKVMPTAGKKEDPVLPDVKSGDPLNLKKLDTTQHFTEPPPRYTEATLVRELEKKGIGRPSTYAAIISIIQERGYVKLEKRHFRAEKIGCIVAGRLLQSFAELMNYDFTAQMEEELDQVAAGKLNWHAQLDQFYKKFRDLLEQARDPEQGMRPNEPTPTNIPCPACSRPLLIRSGATGIFLGCSGYRAEKEEERCRHTVALEPEDGWSGESGEEEAKSMMQHRRCPKDQISMDVYSMSDKHRLHICNNHPMCDHYELEEGDFRPPGGARTYSCERCKSPLEARKGRFGAYFACTNQACGATCKRLPDGSPAPPSMTPVPMPELRCVKVDDHYVLRSGANGLFLAASKFPRNRETRAPLLEEIVPHMDDIDERYHYLAEGPTKDSAGNPTVIRFNRKLREIYLSGEAKGRRTGWSAYYRDGAWVVSDQGSSTSATTARRKGGARKSGKRRSTTVRRKKALASMAADNNIDS